jgi:hypothetical protein
MGVADLRAAFGRRRVEARVLLDQSLLDEHTRLDAALTQATADDMRLNRNPEAPAIAERILDLEQRIAEAKTVFVFEQLGRGRWLDLVARHPATDDEQRAGLDHHPDTFIPAALVESCVEVRSPDGDVGTLDLDNATFLAEELNEAEFRKLWAGCLRANLGEADDPKSKAAAIYRRLSSRSSTTAPLEESLAASSSDE